MLYLGFPLLTPQETWGTVFSITSSANAGELVLDSLEPPVRPWQATGLRHLGYSEVKLLKM
jgi:predicted transglutaminase-like cysteine proteinase